MEVLSEHIHLLIQLNPKDSPATAMQHLKGGSSFVLRKEFASEIKTFLWGDSFWAGDYFVESIGEKNGVIGNFVLVFWSKILTAVIVSNEQLILFFLVV